MNGIAWSNQKPAMVEPPASAQIIYHKALLFFPLEVFIFCLGANLDFGGWLMRLALKKGKCWTELCSCRNSPGKARKGDWSCLVVAAQIHDEWARFIADSVESRRIGAFLEGGGSAGIGWCSQHHVSPGTGWDWKSAQHKPLSISPGLMMLTPNPVQWLKLVSLRFLHLLKGFNNFFLPICISRNGAKKQLSWLTQIVIERELVVVPDLEDKLRWNLVFCLVQAPEVLLQSCQEKKKNINKLINKCFFHRRGKIQTTVTSKQWKSCKVSLVACPAPAAQGQSHRRTPLLLGSPWTRMPSGKSKVLLELGLVPICALI